MCPSRSNAAARRVQEREQREASDTRTEVQKWLGDPPPNRSALAGHKEIQSVPHGIFVSTTRVICVIFSMHGVLPMLILKSPPSPAQSRAFFLCR
jgi:hypothetical protein